MIPYTKHHSNDKVEVIQNLWPFQPWNIPCHTPFAWVPKDLGRANATGSVNRHQWPGWAMANWVDETVSWSAFPPSLFLFFPHVRHPLANIAIENGDL